MAGGIDLAQGIYRHEGINLGSGYRGMPEKFLNYSNVGPALEKVGGKRMPQGMWRNLPHDLGLISCITNDLPSRLPR
jgi:hypothetical protein